MNEIPTNNPEFFPDGLMENVVTEATTSTEYVNNNKRNGKVEAPDKIMDKNNFKIQKPKPVYDENGKIKYYQDGEYTYFRHKGELLSIN